MRHAFLIIAHNNIEILKYQLRILDADNTGFFVHIDKRTNYNREELEACVQKSTIEIIPPKRIIWGHYSQVDCELRLLKAASARRYDYYHCISRVDMPLHPVSEMDNIMGNKNDVEYIHFDSSEVSKADYDRIRYYHFLPGREPWKRKINGLFIKLEILMGINRLKGKNLIIQKGANWFSISNDLAQAVVRDESKIRRMMKYSFCGDEIFLQTYVMNSPFCSRLASLKFDDDYHMCLRKIDWKRGAPYTFRNEDFEELTNSKDLFARKFDYNTDHKILERLYLRCSMKNSKV